MDTRFDTYLRQLRDTPLDEHTEHTGRAALETLLNRFAAESGSKGFHVQHEPKRELDKGAPDFKVRSAGQILGYVEVKEVGAPLAKMLKSDQIKKYRSLSDNIILTNYLDFLWIGPQGDPKTGVRERATLAHQTDIEASTLRIKPENATAVAKLLQAFFSEPPQGIGRSPSLALALASRTQLLRDFLTIELTRQAKEKTEGRLHALYDVFRRQVFQELTVKEFADAFAQMLAYGLFLARLNAGANETVTLRNVDELIPGSFRLIRELAEFLKQLQLPEYKPAEWIVDEVLSIVNGLDLAAIQSDLSFRQRKAISRKVRAGDEEEHRLFERDPFIYFYEDYLKAYDPDIRESRGVYYTPPPIVNFIVRAVDDILKDTFGIKDGLADHNRVTVLDFACGTGTFLLEVFQRVFDNVGGPGSGKADPIVREHLTQNVFGFEYLIAPYTIAHLKLSQYLKEQGHPLAHDERLNVFLTNTLEPIKPQRDFNYPAISAEVEAAQRVKDRDILAIVGNPPYSGHSKNKGKWISAQIGGYKYTVERKLTGTDKDGNEVYSEEKKPLGERNSKWLNDDYVKFIRFAQLKMDAVSEGVVGIITNHSWLDNPTFRGMRQSLMRSFDQIYVLDLHGSTKPKERAPAGCQNENVFDIQKGVAITLFVKRSGEPKVLRFSEFWGTRLGKYEAAAAGNFNALAWADVQSFEPYYLFRPIDWSGWDEYVNGWSIADSLSPESEKRQIFGIGNVGLATGRDEIVVQFTQAGSEEVVRSIKDGNEVDSDAIMA